MGLLWTISGACAVWLVTSSEPWTFGFVWGLFWTVVCLAAALRDVLR